MVELEINDRSWTVNTGLELGDVPDVAKKYSTLVFRPDSMSFRFTQEGDSLPLLDKILVTGPRVLKDGLGIHRVTDKFHPSYETLPDWLAAMAASARGMVMVDFLNGY